MREGRRKYEGRGSINFKSVKEPARAVYNPDLDALSTPLSKEGLRLLLQSRRLIALRNIVQSYNKIVKANSERTLPEGGDDDPKIAALEVQARGCINKILVDLKTHDDPRGDIAAIDPDNMQSIPPFFTLTRLAQQHVHRSHGLTLQNQRNNRHSARQKLRGRGAHRVASNALKDKHVAPLSFLKRPEDAGPGKPKGSYATDPAEVDCILHSIWDKITDGNLQDPAQAAKNFCNKYNKYIHKASQFKVADLTVDDFINQCHHDTESAAGLDGWAARDLDLLSRHAIQLLVDMLNHIELGGHWPKAMLATRAVFLSKDAGDTSNPLAYRILKITSGIYRKWGSTRIKDLNQWIQEWDDGAINAGVPGKGAVDAWHTTALDIEYAITNNIKLAGGSIDVYKCFDQLNRELVFALAQEAGMPTRILNAYKEYITNMQTHFQVANTIGKPYQDRASLPQGCPFSMMMVSLLLKPWINLMRVANVTPRCLADDLMIIATGHGHQSRTIKGMTLSRAYFQDIGAKVADKKCFCFATDTSTRSFLARYDWDGQGLQIPVINSFRDIGTHVNVTTSNNGKTLTDRMSKARYSTNRLRWLPMPLEFKQKIVQANILPAGLYGCEAAWVNKSCLKAFRAAVANALGPRSNRASNEVVFHNTSTSKDLDPSTYILLQRVLTLRRTLSKYPERIDQVKSIIGKYNNELLQEPNTKVISIPQGPVALLMHSLKECGATLRDDFNVVQPNEPYVDIWHMPWQHLKNAIQEIAANARTRVGTESRQHMKDLHEIDGSIHKQIIHSLAPKERKVFNHLSSGAAWSEEHKANIGLSNGECKLCGACTTDITHVAWECEHVHKHREHRALVDIDHKLLPTYIKHGLAKALTSDVQCTFWGDRPTNVHDVSAATCDAVGLPVSKAKDVIASCKNQEIQDCLKRHGINSSALNARQCFRALKANKGPPHLAMPYRCHRAPPADINVYTDGSWAYPLKEFLGIGGAGVWWPNRDPNIEHRLSQAEKDIAHHKQFPEGAMLYTPIGGYGGSSTRTELAAAIVAILANGPVHIGSDSQAFIDKASDILYKLRLGKPLKCNWKTTSDGDLWEHFTKAAMAKGPKSIRLTKVKGHVTTQQVLDKIFRDCDKKGNDKADHAADLAVQMHGEDVISVAKILQARHRKYTSLMKDVVKHIVEAYLIHKELVEMREGKLHKARGSACTPNILSLRSKCHYQVPW